MLLTALGFPSYFVPLVAMHYEIWQYFGTRFASALAVLSSLMVHCDACPASACNARCVLGSVASLHTPTSVQGVS